MEIILLIIYFLSLSVLFGFGIHGLVMLYYYHKTLHIKEPEVDFDGEYPQVTIQLPIFNEMYVVERLIEAVCNIDYPQDKMEIQVLDDSTDNTVALSEKLCNEYSDKGFLFLNKLLISDKEIKKYNINVQNVDVRIR